MANFQLHLLDDSILHVNVSQEWLIIVDNLCSFDKETIALKGGCNITQLRMQELNKDMVLPINLTTVVFLDSLGVIVSNCLVHLC